MGLKLMLAVALTAGAAAARQDNTLTEDEKKAGWKLLFDGTSTAAWRGWKKDKFPADHWKAIDGVLVLDKKGGGDILTVEQFENFEFSIDWKVAPGGNSGIMYRVAETEGAPYMTGPECQVLDDDKHPDGKKPKTSAGSLYDVFEPAKKVAKPAGEWNRAKIVCNGKKIEHWLNGEKIVDCEVGSEEWNKRIEASKWKKAAKFAREAKGHIDLQDHGDRVEFKNIKIREIK